VAMLVLPHTVNHLRDAPEVLIDIAEAFASYELIFTLAAAAIISRKFFRVGFLLFLLPTIAGFFFFGNRILTVLSQTWEGPLPAMARYAAGSDLPILVYDMRKPSVPFYTHRQVIQPSTPEQLESFLKSSKGAYVLSKSKRNKFFRDLNGCKVLYAEGKFILVRYSPSAGLASQSASKFAFH
ncbi:MAG: hypothetical protein K2X81_26695, partial [Candidatus Obscuribacterales bacterium]|nr:hypothetical protein [Candidatus Obscuribacterales bacterium]